MEKRIYPEPTQTIISPEPFVRQTFTDARQAVDALKQLYARNTRVPPRTPSRAIAHEKDLKNRYRAYYPEVGVTVLSYSQVDSRQAYGHMSVPGHFTTTITRPDLFETYLIEQLRLHHEKSWHAGRGVGIGYADPAAFRLSGRRACRRLGGGAPAAGRSATSSTCPTSTAPTTSSPTAHMKRSPASRGRWRRSPRSASTIRCTGCRITRRPRPTISRISCCSPTISSTSTSSASMRATLMAKGGGGYSAFVEPGNLVTPAGEGRADLRHHAAAHAANARLSPEEAGPCRHYHDQYRRRPVQRQDHHRPRRGAAAACLAHARPLRRPAQHAEPGGLRAGACLCARGPCSRRRPSRLGSYPGACRNPGGDAGGGRRGNRSSTATT